VKSQEGEQAMPDWMIELFGEQSEIRRRDLPLRGQLKPSIHTSFAKAHSYSLGFCQFCGLSSSVTGSASPRTPLAGSRRSSSNPFFANKNSIPSGMLFLFGGEVKFYINTLLILRNSEE